MTQRMYSKRKASSVKDILSNVLQKKQIEKKSKSFEFLAKWDQIVGSDTALVSFPEKLNKGILTVRVIDAVYAQELSFNKQHYLEKLAILGYAGSVTDIKFVIGNPANFKNSDN